jgi:hypothetical protein
LSLSLPLLASGASVEDIKPKMVFHTKNSSLIIGKMNGKLSSSHRKVQFSTTMSTVKILSLKIGVKYQPVI